MIGDDVARDDRRLRMAALPPDLDQPAFGRRGSRRSAPPRLPSAPNRRGRAPPRPRRVIGIGRQPERRGSSPKWKSGPGSTVTRHRHRVGSSMSGRSVSAGAPSIEIAIDAAVIAVARRAPRGCGRSRRAPARSARPCRAAAAPRRAPATRRCGSPSSEPRRRRRPSARACRAAGRERRSSRRSSRRISCPKSSKASAGTPALASEECNAAARAKQRRPEAEIADGFGRRETQNATLPDASPPTPAGSPSLMHPPPIADADAHQSPKKRRQSGRPSVNLSLTISGAPAESRALCATSRPNGGATDCGRVTLRRGDASGQSEIPPRSRPQGRKFSPAERKVSKPLLSAPSACSPY